jgi:hypothetical protein
MEEVEFKVAPQPKAEPVKPKPVVTEKIEMTSTKTIKTEPKEFQLTIGPQPKVGITTTTAIKTEPKVMEEVEFKVAPQPKAEPVKPKPVVTEKIEMTSTKTIKTEPKVKEEVEFKVAPQLKPQIMKKVEFAVAPKPEAEKPKMAPIFEEEKETESILVNKGQDVILTTTVKSEPKPQVSWLKNEEPLRQTRNIQLKAVDSTYTVVIKAANPDDSGTYKCKATNVLGTSFKTFDVNIEGIHCNLDK